MIDFKKMPEALRQYGKAHEFAKVEALTKTAQRCQGAAREKQDEQYELRNKHAQSAVRITPATMQKPESEVYVKDAHYIVEHETGGTRAAKDGGQPVPADIYEQAARQLTPTKVIPVSYRKKKILEGKLQGYSGRTKKRQARKLSAFKSGNKPFVAEMPGGVTGVFIRLGKERFPLGLLYYLEMRAKKIKKDESWFEKPVGKAYDHYLEPEFDKAADRAVERYMQKYFR